MIKWEYGLLAFIRFRDFLANSCYVFLITTKRNIFQLQCRHRLCELILHDSKNKVYAQIIEGFFL